MPDCRKNWQTLWRISRPILTFFTHLEIHGAENLGGLEGPAILFSNHIRFLDPFAIGAAFPFGHPLFPIHYLTQYESYTFNPGLFHPWLKKFPLISLQHFYDFAGCIPTITDPDNKKDRTFQKINLECIRKSLEILSEGGTLGFFPEGKRSPDGNLQPFFPGVGYIILKTIDVPIVPIVLSGSNKIPPLDFLLGEGKVIVHFGAPFNFKLGEEEITKWRVENTKDGIEPIVNRHTMPLIATWLLEKHYRQFYDQVKAQEKRRKRE